MQFHSARTLKSGFTKRSWREHAQGRSETQVLEAAAEAIDDRSDALAYLGQAQFIASGRPTYRMWPKLLPSWDKIDFEKVQLDQLLPPLPAFACAFARDHEPRAGDWRLRAVMYSWFQIEGRVEPAHFNAELDIHNAVTGEETGTSLNIALTTDDVMSCVADSEENHAQIVAEGLGIPPTIVTALSRLAFRYWAVVCLLQDDDYVERVILKADQHKAMPGNRAELEARAERRGLYLWDVGKVADVQVHFRSPHFAIRWTGPGRKIPKLRPIKGSIVHREKQAKPVRS